jgi:hypothetical protein
VHGFNALSPTHDSINFSDPGGPSWPASDASSQLDAEPSPTGISIAVNGSASRGAPQGSGANAYARASDGWNFTLSEPACFTLSATLNVCSTAATVPTQTYNFIGVDGPGQIIPDLGTPPGAFSAGLTTPGTLSRSASGRLLAGRYAISLKGEASGSSFPYSGSYAHTVVLTISHCPGDCEADGDTDLDDYEALAACLDGPGGGSSAVGGCECTDFDGDGDTDLTDFAEFQAEFTGP